MHKRLLPLLVTFLLASTLVGQEFRAIDGSGNNLNNPSWGSAGKVLKNILPYQYTDGVSLPAGADRPNPRYISSAIFNQPGLLVDPTNLSDFAWVFGQFVDHEITFVTDTSEFLPISVPAGDPFFDPDSTGQQIIPMSRSTYDPTTGNAAGNPRRHINKITSWVDASAVYGSDTERANWLRTFSEGKLKTSAGNLLPYNTLTGEKDAPVDPTAPHMDNPVGLTDKVFVAGDARANENPLLASYHTLFMREHNRMCDEILQKHPYFTDEQVYQHARKMVSGILQAILFEEWLPAFGLELPRYNGYNPYLDPRISNVFSAAAYRLGHTMLNGNIMRLDVNGEVLPEGNITLKNAFFNVAALEDIGLDPYFKGMAAQIAQELDAKVIDDVRNFLFGPPGSGGLDLVSINIQRGRERGLPDFNAVRSNLGLAPYTSFDQISSNPDEIALLSQVYGDINRIDAWVGMLMEDPMPGAVFGEVLMKILKEQFRMLRDGDRFYYENDPDLKYSEKNMIRNTRMVDIIRRNTNVEIMQEHVFKAMPHDSVPQCEAQLFEASIEGKLTTVEGLSLEGVEIELYDGATMAPSQYSNILGAFSFATLPTCKNYVLIPYNDEAPDNGVTTADLIRIQKHVLGIQKFSSPYKKLAADANKSGNISTADLIAIRKVILNPITGTFPNNTSWRFLKSDYSFDGSTNPLMDDMPESVMVEMFSDNTSVDFMGIKTGDVDGSANPNLNLLQGNERHFSGSYEFLVQDVALRAGETYRIPFHPGSAEALAGFQLTLQVDEDRASITGLFPGSVAGFEEEVYMLHGNSLTLSWNDFGGVVPESDWFILEVKAKEDGQLSDILKLTSAITPAEAYDGKLDLLQLNLRFENDVNHFQNQGFVLFQNQPNPFHNQTQLSFSLPANQPATITVSDVSGKILYSYSGDFTAGLNTVTINKQELSGLSSGILVYRLESGDQIASRSMIVVD